MPLVLHRYLFLIFLYVLPVAAKAAIVKGVVTNELGEALSFSSITIKNTTKGTVANSHGAYALSMPPGEFVMVCHHVGYKVMEQSISVEGSDITINFKLSPQALAMPEVVIKKGEDPALEIMRQAIKKRAFYNRQVDSFTVDVYIKGIIRSGAVPNKVLGQKVDKAALKRQGIDSIGRGILFLSESETKVAFTHPDKIKMEVVSSRKSGSGYGLSVPFSVNFYSENVVLLNGNMAPRGFISPLADAAFRYYSFRYEGNFFEGDRMIDRIRVTPKRKNDPLFSGFIQVVDGEWRLHSVSLSVCKNYSLDLLDTVKITQVHAAINDDTWRVQNQVISFAANILGFNLAGNFLNVYSNYNVRPGFPKKFFDRIILKYNTAFNKRDSSYLGYRRPVALEPEENHSFLVKDSVQKKETDSMYSQSTIDSLRRARKPVRLRQFFWGGISRNFYDSVAWKTYRLEPMFKGLQFNSVEGVTLSTQQTYTILPRYGHHQFNVGLNTRYGFSNKHLNIFGSFSITPKSSHNRNQSFIFSGGKRVLQFNRENPIAEFSNSLSTLFYRRNYLKIYETWFGRAEYSRKFDNGLRLQATVNYEDRMPLENRNDFSLFYKDNDLLPNHPYELASVSFTAHAATVASVTVSFQPGQKYIQLPERKVAIGSSYPTFEIQYTKGLPGLFNSTANFDKWRLTSYDEVNLKLLGQFRYRANIGGFLQNENVDLPDFQHFNGNQLLFNYHYLNSFQLAPYYRYSTTTGFYTLVHAEHHFNGLLTNKVPLFNRLKWHLVGGTNTFYVNNHNYYMEVFAGFENIFKILRVDFITTIQPEPGRQFGLRFGFGGVIGNGISIAQ